MPDYSPHDRYLNFGDIGTSSMYFSIVGCTCMGIGNHIDRRNHRQVQGSLETWNQFLYMGITEENEHIRFTSVWLSKGENGKYKLTCRVYFNNVKRECKLDMNIHMLKLVWMYNIPIYVHSNLLRHKMLILGGNILGNCRTVFSQWHTTDPSWVASHKHMVMYLLDFVIKSHLFQGRPFLSSEDHFWLLIYFSPGYLTCCGIRWAFFSLYLHF